NLYLAFLGIHSVLPSVPFTHSAWKRSKDAAKNATHHRLAALVRSTLRCYFKRCWMRAALESSKWGRRIVAFWLAKLLSLGHVLKDWAVICSIGFLRSV